MPNETNVPLLGQKNSAMEAPETDQENPIVEAESAFLVLIHKGGQTVVTPDITTAVITERQATVNEIYHCALDIAKDIEKEESAMLVAQHVLNAQMQLARQVQEAQANAQVMQQMGRLPGVPK